MVGVGKHVDRLHGRNTVFRIEELQVTRLRSRVAADIHDAVRCGIENHIDYIFVHTCARGVDYHYIGAAVGGDELVGKYIFHVAGIELGVVQAVDTGVEFGILYGFGDVFDADDMASVRGDEIGFGAGAGIEVVDEFAAGESGKIASHTVEPLGLA